MKNRTIWITMVIMMATIGYADYYNITIWELRNSINITDQNITNHTPHTSNTTYLGIDVTNTTTINESMTIMLYYSGITDYCSLSHINTSKTIDLSKNCTLSTEGIVSNPVNFTNAETYHNASFNASINFTGGWNNLTANVRLYVLGQNIVRVGA